MFRSSSVSIVLYKMDLKVIKNKRYKNICIDMRKVDNTHHFVYILDIVS
jgi:hypothetical protein